MFLEGFFFGVVFLFLLSKSKCFIILYIIIFIYIIHISMYLIHILLYMLRYMFVLRSFG